ncbi:MAG: ATP-binding cassette domain-containing protein [Chloroflexi bacterium]|nr:ATP-binding cassette domain-containing protein [Chloroflexota bacterium]
MADPLLIVRDLSMTFLRRAGLFGRRTHQIRALNQVSFTIEAGETFGIVGESGCGKSTLARCLLRLLRPTGGGVRFDGVDLLALGDEEMRRMRQRMQIVLQNPFSSLNPRLNGFDLIAEPLRTHMELSRKEMTDRVASLLAEVGLSGEFMSRHPHQLSGGQAQRIALARALAPNPAFLILDEPTSALDVSVQAQIINLLLRLQRQRGLAYLFITHDLSVIQHISDRIAVMYLGRIVEETASEEIFADPQHPYTQALLSSTPMPDPASGGQRIILPGTAPSAANPPAGCAFHPRCSEVMEQCRSVFPASRLTAPDHQVSCHLYDHAQ